MPIDLRRLEGWDVALAQYLIACDSLALSYGRFDCALWVAGAIEAMTGIDLGGPYRGRYSDSVSAGRVLAAAGWKDVFAVADAFLPPISAQEARRGDVLGLLGEDGPTLGIAIGGAAIALSSEGPGRAPLDAAVRGWRVG